MMRRCLWLACVAMLSFSTTATGQPAARVPVIVLERAEMLPGERVPVRLVFPDPQTAPAVTGLCVRLLGPSYLTLGGGPEPDRAGPACAAPALGPFRVEAPLTFDLVAGQRLREGKVAVVFDLAFDEGRPRRVAVEKTLDLGVLGIGSISGVPLQLAVLILPGLAALAVARVFGVGWVGALQTLEAGALAFAVSAIFAGVFDWGVGVESSLLRVLLLIVLGLLLGVVLGVVSYFAKTRERNAAAAAAEAATVAPGDDVGIAVAKALRLNAKRLDPDRKTVVRLDDGRRMEGSLTAPISAGGVVVLGWFEVEATATAKAGLDKAFAAGEWDALGERLAAALAAKQAGLRLRERVRVFDGQGQSVEADRNAMVRVAAENYSAEESPRSSSPDTGQRPIRAITLKA